MSRRPLPLPLRNWLSRLRLKAKFTLSVVVVAVTAALIASVVLLLFRLQALKQDRMANSLALTQIVADNVTGAVAFEDSTAAAEILRSLKAQPLVVGALVSTPKTARFATYGQVPSPTQMPLAEEPHFESWIVLTRTPIRHGAEVIGQLYLQTDLNPALAKTLRAASFSLLVALITASLLGLGLSRLLRGFILQPIESLGETARHVAQSGEFTQRAVVWNHDELGELAEAFNHMLASLQTSDVALRESNAALAETLAERTRLEKDLIAISRQAGMAQVATGVLHNVGNVLNSVNVSAQVIKQALSANSHFALLQKTTELLREQGAEVGKFLTENPRGKLVPNFLIELGNQIEILRRDLLKENAHLTENIEHIKQIVAMQQSHAKTGGVIQRVPPAELFAEASRLVHGSVERHGVTLTTEFADDVPTITTDRHQVLQILVNFITNAVQATKLNPAGGQRTIGLHLHAEAGELHFTVSDNGIGIPPENLGRIFRHGFTTRKDGHGFGLHSGALVAKNLGGQLRVHSDGPGLGARFTLILPLGKK